MSAAGAETTPAVPRSPTVKVHFVGSGNKVQASNVILDPTALASAATYEIAGALSPPYPLDTLASLYEQSSILRPNVEAIITNVDQFGWRFEPVIDFTQKDADDRVTDVIRANRRKLKRDPATRFRPDVIALADDPTPAEVAAKRIEIERGMRQEKVELDALFDALNRKYSLPELRSMMREDELSLGNGYWEVLRDAMGQFARINWIPGFTMRLMPRDTVPTDLTYKVLGPDLEYSTVEDSEYLRRYVQVIAVNSLGTNVAGAGVAVVYFKEYGDPRIFSRKTGREWASVEALKKNDPNDAPATEIVHFKVASPRYEYGLPPWYGALLSVLGTRQAEEVNYLYFDNKSIPPLAILVNGGTLGKESVERLADYIETEIKGTENFHKILVLEAETGTMTPLAGGGAPQGKVQIEIKPLTDAQQKDALFLQYDERNEHKVARQLRVPPLLRGDTKDFNRATAQASMEYAEVQVFAPRRKKFDWLVNRRFLSDMGIRFWKFASNGPTLSDPTTITDNVTALVEASIMTPGEARIEAAQVVGHDLPVIDEEWTKRPPSVSGGGGFGGRPFGAPAAVAAPSEPAPVSPAPQAEPSA